MGAKVLLTEEEYLSTSFGDREPEYVDGDVVERSLPNYPHSKAQRELVFRVRSLQEKHSLFACPELRVQVAPKKYRIPDLVVYSGTEPVEEIPKDLPLVIAEVVSPEDKHADIIKRLKEYRAWGVPNVWLVDPVVGEICVYGDSGLTPVPAFDLPQFQLRITQKEILG